MLRLFWSFVSNLTPSLVEFYEWIDKDSEKMESVNAIGGKCLNLCSILRFGCSEVILLHQQNHCVDCAMIIFVVDLLFPLLHNFRTNCCIFVHLCLGLDSGPFIWDILPC
jgi:hypothetical protein